tara:strand:- start:2909 stop:3388 length:480 start_codon:yes stop_codon:yes gene_type:complete
MTPSSQKQALAVIRYVESIDIDAAAPSVPLIVCGEILSNIHLFDNAQRARHALDAAAKRICMGKQEAIVSFLKQINEQEKMLSEEQGTRMCMARYKTLRQVSCELLSELTSGNIGERRILEVIDTITKDDVGFQEWERRDIAQAIASARNRTAGVSAGV